MPKRKLFLALAMASYVASSWLEPVAAGTCVEQPQDQTDAPFAVMLRLAADVAVFGIGASEVKPPQSPDLGGLKDIANDLKNVADYLFPPPVTKKEDLAQLLCDLQIQLQRGIGVLFNHETLLDINEQTAHIKTALDTAQVILKGIATEEARLLKPGETPDVYTQDAINLALLGTANGGSALSMLIRVPMNGLCGRMAKLMRRRVVRRGIRWLRRQALIVTPLMGRLLPMSGALSFHTSLTR